MDPLSLLAVFGPLAVEAGKSLISRFVAPKEFKPATIDQYVAMRKLDLEIFTTMNNVGGSDPSYPWVSAIVRLMRPILATIILGTWAVLKFNGSSDESVDSFAGAVGFYIFGDRTLFYAKKNTANHQ